MIFDICNILFIYVFYVFIIRKTFSAEQTKNKWNYIDCNIFINDLDIVCSNFSEDLNGANICHDWSIFNQSNIIYLPEECANKIYTIEEPQKNFNIIIANNYIIPKKYRSNSNKYTNVNTCIKVYNTILKGCSLEEDFENCKIVKNKLNITDFCVNTILGIIEAFQNRVESIINQKYKKEVKFLQNLGPLNDKKLNNFNDYEPKKDCIEYGLKSISEEILVCLKYE